MNEKKNIVPRDPGAEIDPRSPGRDATSPARTPRNLEEINEQHIRSVDKFFRMCAGVASKLTGFRAGFLYLDVRVDDRLRVPVETIVRNIAASWRQEKELNGARGYSAVIYQRLRWSGFSLRPDATAQQMEEAIRRMKEPSNQPDTFLKVIEEEYDVADLLKPVPSPAAQEPRSNPEGKTDAI